LPAIFVITIKKTTGSNKYEYVTRANNKSFSTFGFPPKIEKLL
jgi:hypothetical protein